MSTPVRRLSFDEVQRVPDLEAFASMLEAALTGAEGREAARHPPGRFAAYFGIDPEALRDPLPDVLWPLVGGWAPMKALGEFPTLAAAGQALQVAFEELSREVFETEPEGKLHQWLRDGPWEVPEDQVACFSTSGLDFAKYEHPTSIYEFAAFTGAPFEGTHTAILRLPPPGPGSELIDACRDDNLERAGAALGCVDIDATNSEGLTALHFAVAKRSLALVRLLCDAGANPNAGVELMHPPSCTQAVEDKVLPAVWSITDDNHFEILRCLVEAGADLRATGPDGKTLADLAANHSPLRDDWLQWLVARGASSRLLRGLSDADAAPDPVDTLLDCLHFRSRGELEVLPNKIRLLSLLGATEPNRDKHSRLGRTTLVEFLHTGYAAEEVQPELLKGVVRALIAIGARNIESDGCLPSELAAKWAERDSMRHYEQIAQMLRAAG